MEENSSPGEIELNELQLHQIVAQPLHSLQRRHSTKAPTFQTSRPELMDILLCILILHLGRFSFHEIDHGTNAAIVIMAAVLEESSQLIKDNTLWIGSKNSRGIQTTESLRKIPSVCCGRLLQKRKLVFDSRFAIPSVHLQYYPCPDLPLVAPSQPCSGSSHYRTSTANRTVCLASIPSNSNKKEFKCRI